MPDENDKIIQERFRVLPKDVRAAILSPEFERNVDFVRNRHGLSVEKAAPLQNEALLLMIGMISPKEFSTNLSESLGIPVPEAELVAHDIDSRIIAPIKQSLIAFVNSENKDEGVGKEKIEQFKNLNQPIIPPLLQTKSVPPANLPTAELPSKHENEFLPMLVKKTDARQQTMGNRQETIDSRRQTAGSGQEIMENRQRTIDHERPRMRETPKTPGMTSALAAEIGNLLSKKENGQQTADSRQPELAPKTFIEQTSIPGNVVMPPRPMADNRQRTIDNRQQTINNQQSIINNQRPEIQSVGREAENVKRVMPEGIVPPRLVTMPRDPASIKPPMSVQQTIDNRQQNTTKPQLITNDRQPPSPRPAPQTAIRPIDKMVGMIQQPKVEVEMVKKETRPAPTPDKKSQSDPYREPI